MPNKTKLIVILGPTASGKSALAMKLAKKFGGEIVSADSRQVYRGLDIGTGKVLPRDQRGIRHHLLDVADPKRQFSVVEYQTLANRAITEIRKRGRLPILVGGTGLYIDAVARGLTFPEVPPNQKLRSRLEKKKLYDLLSTLTRLDPKRAKIVDRKNARRIIRAIEIAKALGKVPPLSHTSPYRTLWIGATHPPKELRRKIRARLHARIREGMIDEAKRLQRTLRWKRFYELGLEYRYLADFLRKKIGKAEMLRELEQAIAAYAKRQLTWFRKHHDIHWIRNPHEAEQLVRKFLRTI